MQINPTTGHRPERNYIMKESLYIIVNPETKDCIIRKLTPNALKEVIRDGYTHIKYVTSI